MEYDEDDNGHEAGYDDADDTLPSQYTRLASLASGNESPTRCPIVSWNSLSVVVIVYLAELFAKS